MVHQTHQGQWDSQHLHRVSGGSKGRERRHKPSFSLGHQLDGCLSLVSGFLGGFFFAIFSVPVPLSYKELPYEMTVLP